MGVSLIRVLHSFNPIENYYIFFILSVSVRKLVAFCYMKNQKFKIMFIIKLQRYSLVKFIGWLHILKLTVIFWKIIKIQ